MSGKRRKNQLLLAFMAESRSESPMAAIEGTEPRVAKQSSESPTQTDSLMEEVCQRDNLWKALADALYGNDAHISEIRAKKRWAEVPGIQIVDVS